MKTLEQIAKEYKSQTFDGRDLSRLADFLPYDMLNSFGITLKKGVTKEDWDKKVKPFTRKNILEQLKSDVAFGFEKALNHRGISSALMFEVVKMWNWILEEGLEDWGDDNYAMYGLPLFKAVAIIYGFENPIGDDSGSEEEYNEH
jgi:hypothetical protein